MNSVSTHPGGVFGFQSMIMNHPHHHHPHHPHHHHPHAHPGVAIGPLPNPCIGMVAAPTAAGPVLAGIGVPIMTAAAPLVPPPPPLPPSHQQAAQQQHQHSVVHNGKKLVMSADSSDDNDKCGGHPFIQARTSPSGGTVVSCSAAISGGSQLTWTSAPLQQAAPAGTMMPAGIAYPVMGLPPGALTGEANAAATGMIYGVPIADHQVSAGVNSVISLPTSSGVVVTSVQPPPAISISPVIPAQSSQPGSTTIPPQPGTPTSQQQQSSQQQPTKEIIHCKSCTLFPPNPNAPPPTTRDKPPGCRTAFVGGLPENIREDIVREIFERCGEITTIRMSKKNFCHIRFEMEECVELALYLSGYRIRIGSNSDSANIGRFHVDYAQARDDLYEWECRQRQLMREQRHRERLEQERLHPPSPPPTVHYSDHEAANVAERIKADDTFMKAIQILFNWLEKGECLKRNSNTFYSMVQSTNSQIRRLLNEKSQYEDEYQKAKDLMRQRVTGLLMQFTQIEKVFSAACHRKVWDHFSKAQRKNIEVWKKQAAEIKNVLLEEALNERADEEMEFSDLESDSSGHSNKENGEPPRAKKMRLTGEDSAKTVHQLKEENDALRCQLEASKNEVDLIKADLRSELEMKDQQLRSLQQQFMDIQRKVSSFQQPPILTSCPSSSNNAGKGISPVGAGAVGNYATTGSSSSTSSANMNSTGFTKQMLHSPPVSVSSSSSSPGFGMSPAHAILIPPTGNGIDGGGGGTTTAAKESSTDNNSTCSTLNKDLSMIGSNNSVLYGSKTSSSNKDMQGFCDSSSSICHTGNVNANLVQQSAQNNQHNQSNGSNGESNDASAGTNGSSSNNNSNSSNSGAGTDNGEDNQNQHDMIFMGAAIDINSGSGSATDLQHHDQVIIGVNDKEAKLLGIVSTFLHVHPFGASLDYIWSYAQKVLPMVRPNQIEVLMTKFPSLFKQEVSGIGATFERKWVFVGFS